MRILRFTLCAVLSVTLVPAAFAISYVVPPDAAMVGRADAIVIARATASHAEENERGIVTVTTFAVEDVLKGDASLVRGITVREPGGVLDGADGKKHVRIFPGAPQFINGEQVLLDLTDVGNGLFAVTDFELGLMKLTTDDLGHRVALRPPTEGLAWALDGKIHKEPRRDADRFVEYVRSVAAGKPANPDYAIEPRPLLHDVLAAGKMSLRPAPLSAFTITQYTLIKTDEAGPGARWSVFPTAVNWNRGNSMAHLSNGGSDAINTAFAAWAVGTSVNFFLASTTANLTGACGACGDPPDGVNNIVFEKNLTADGAPAFSCATGGVFGEGAPHAYSATTHTLGGETFFSITEADVSFNQGVDACIGAAWPAERIGSALMHEIGHGLGLRHSDQSRDLNQPCTNFATYDCSSSAIMQPVVPTGFNSTQQPWDTRAITALYPPSSAPNAPTGVTATTTDATHILISWTAPAGGAAKYHVYRCTTTCTLSLGYSQVNGETTTTTSYPDTVTTNTEFIYKVRAVNASNIESADSSKDNGVGVAFTDATLTATVTKIKAVHVTELRTLVTSLCTAAGNPAPCSTALTDPTITAMSTKVKAAHVAELRARVDAARAALGITPASYTDTTITALSTKIKKAHIDDLRAALK